MTSLGIDLDGGIDDEIPLIIGVAVAVCILCAVVLVAAWWILRKSKVEEQNSDVSMRSCNGDEPIYGHTETTFAALK